MYYFKIKHYNAVIKKSYFIDRIVNVWYNFFNFPNIQCTTYCITYEILIETKSMAAIIQRYHSLRRHQNSPRFTNQISPKQDDVQSGPTPYLRVPDKPQHHKVSSKCRAVGGLGQTASSTRSSCNNKLYNYIKQFHDSKLLNM